MRPIELKAIANPYGFLDQDGRAQATVMMVNAPTTPIGAKLNRKHPEGEKRQIFDHHTDAVRVVAHTINEYTHYKRAFDDGHLLPADAATAKILGIPFKDPLAVLEESKQAAVKQWKDSFGTEPLCASQPKAPPAAAPTTTSPKA